MIARAAQLALSTVGTLAFGRWLWLPRNLNSSRRCLDLNQGLRICTPLPSPLGYSADLNLNQQSRNARQHVGREKWIAKQFCIVKAPNV
jgi:hypothetical protein